MRSADRERALKQLVGELELVGIDIAELHLARHIYHRLTTAIRANPRLNRGNHLYDWLAKCYACYACVAVRRLLDKSTAGNRVVSLGSIATRLATDPCLMTREQFVARSAEGKTGLSRRIAESRAHKVYDLFSDSQIQAPNLAHLERALEKARCTCKSIRAHVDKTVAHHDAKPPSAPAKWGELDRAVDEVGELYNQVSVLLTDSSRPDHVPVLIHDWEWVLKEPWIPDPKQQ